MTAGFHLSIPARCWPALGLALLVAGPALAQDAAAPESEPSFFVRLGAGAIGYRTSGRVTAHGNAVPDAHVAFGSHGVATAELGWRLAPQWSLSLLGGVPPTVPLQGEGALERLHTLRKVTYGSALAGVQFHPFGPGWIDPYVGGGIGYAFTLRTRGGSLSELNIADSFGTVLQAGADIRLTERLSLYVDVRKIWLSFDAKGVSPSAAGPQAVRVHVTPDPVLGTIGLSYRF